MTEEAFIVEDCGLPTGRARALRWLPQPHPERRRRGWRLVPLRQHCAVAILHRRSDPRRLQRVRLGRHGNVHLPLEHDH